MVSSSFFEMTQLQRPERLPLDGITWDTTFAGTMLPKLGLTPDTSYSYRVYVLECEPFFDSGSSSYYVGIISTEGLGKRLREHFGQTGAAFTGEHQPKGIVFLYPAASLAVESFVYHALMTVLPLAAFTCGRVGGWTQTAPKSSFKNYKHVLEPQLKREWCMVNGRCLECGGACTAKTCENRVKSSMMSTSSSASCSSVAPPLSNLHNSAATAPQLQPLHQQPLPPPQRVSPVITDDELFDKWFEKWSLSSAEQRGWVPMAKVLPALGENPANACRFLTGGESARSKKVWALGPRGGLPRHGRDCKKMASKRGGGSGDGCSYHVQKAFLKRVALARYRARLLA